MLSFLTSAALGAALAGGSAIAQDTFNVEETAAVCAACHGEDGRPVEPDTPILWGQQFYYLYVQLKDFKSGLRTNEIMQPIVADFTKDQMKAMATFFSEKRWPNIATEKDAAKADRGQVQTRAGECAQCHNTYLGDSRLPRVAGQQEAYLLRTMLEYKNKIRQNDPTMGSLMRSYEDAGIDDLAHYLATL
jgi:cytochrome c553